MERRYVVFNLKLRKYWTGRGWFKFRKFAHRFEYKYAAIYFVAGKKGAKFSIQRVA